MASFTSSRLLFIGAALFGLVKSSALPGGLLFSRQSTTPDGTCGIVESGAGNGYRCPTGAEKCCSQYGWCGDTTDHCGTGCQSAYGTCTTSGGGGGTTDPGRPRPGSVPYGIELTQCTTPGKVALTFDDGPYIYTQTVLNILSSNSAKATFFLNGQNWGDPITSAANTQVVQNMLAAGHQIGSHTWSHPSLSSLSTADMTTQMTQLETALINIIGKYPTYMRAPYFDCDATCRGVMDTLSYHVIGTNLDTQDWANTANIQASRDIFSNVINPSDPTISSFIVLAHDVHPTTVEGLVQHMIDTARNKGYTLVTVGECLGDPAANWYRV